MQSVFISLSTTPDLGFIDPQKLLIQQDTTAPPLQPPNPGAGLRSSTILNGKNRHMASMNHPGDGASAEQREFLRQYDTLQGRAEVALQDARIMYDVGSPLITHQCWGQIFTDLSALADGRIAVCVPARSPQSAPALARAMEAEKDRALDLATNDLVQVARWHRSSSTRTGASMTDDAVRRALVKRVEVLQCALPGELQQYATAALMHVEHEELNRKYVNDETMYGENIRDIPRSKFFTTEDGYAWDLEELVKAIEVNGGVMRNPLTRQMFTEADIRAIVRHPLGKYLAALSLEQSNLVRGVREATIRQLETLSQTLLSDENTDQIVSRHAIDSFVAYIATLPEVEQKTLDTLRVPATDSHTGQAYDLSIREAVQDAQGNRVCHHKTGDFLRQAARHLRLSRTG